ncbi:FecR domain-containing protein [Fulvivirgaceae bacterium BMA12]|uniref:FecR domain-containing protein n=1 Tax=Agaribacillus aureus TaxID=3051825 RepID=A0ABT8L7N8_9BACT|nr:FecR domain-containing protein [Fulvivirgaceae bacterium BMA12]
MYKNFDIEDFVRDDKFREWVLRPNPEINYFWEKWLLQNADKAEIINDARQIILATKFQRHEISPGNRERLWEKIDRSNQTFDQQTQLPKTVNIKPLYPSDTNKPDRSKPIRRIAYGTIAAAVALVFLIFNWQQPKSEEVAAKPEARLIVKSNSPGQKSELRLPDGSIVYLNAESSLRYVEYFQEDKRQVFLQGEAFFQVVKDSLRPFTVFTKNLATTALGTSFNIQAFGEKEQIKVALITGKVIVRDTVTNNSLSLDPGEGMVLKEPAAEMSKNNIDIEKTLYWKNQTIHFDNTDFYEAIDYLERWYGVQFEIENYSQKAPLTCSGVYKNQSLDNVLNILGFALNFDYEIDKKKINIMFKSK